MPAMLSVLFLERMEMKGGARKTEGGSRNRPGRFLYGKVLLGWHMGVLLGPFHTKDMKDNRVVRDKGPGVNNLSHRLHL